MAIITFFSFCVTQVGVAQKGNFDRSAFVVYEEIMPVFDLIICLRQLVIAC